MRWLKIKESREDISEFQELIEGLNEHNPNSRDLAEAKLKALGPEAAEQLLSYLDYVKDAPRRWLRATIISSLIITFALLVMNWVWAATGVEQPVPWITPFGGALGSYLLFRMVGRENRRQAATAIAMLDDPRLLSPLIDSLAHVDRDTSPRLIEALEQRFSRLTPEDGNTLTAENHASINKALLTQPPRVVEALLKGLEQVGNSGALPFLKRLAMGQGVAGADSSVRTRAQNCLTIMENRLAQERVRQRLLRPSASPEPESDLLRSAAGVPTEDEIMLLRPDSRN